MSIKHSIASKKKWVGISKKERSLIMSRVAFGRWGKKISKEKSR